MKLIRNIWKKFLLKDIYYLNHKDGSKELIQITIYKQTLPQSKNDLGNECLSKYLTKLNWIDKLKLI